MKSVVDGATMRLLEEKAFAGKETVESLMDVVGKGLASFLSTLLPASGESPHILLIAGKGNNGADGYSALSLLAEKNIPTVVWQIVPPPEGSILEKRQKKYLQKGGKVISFPDVPQMESPFLILDGIYGAGFKGPPDGTSSKAILWANAQHGLIVSIDLPSGLDPTTGEVPGEAIIADYTVACHLPKRGCFLGKGWEYTGIMHVVSLPIETPKSDLCLLEEEDVVHLIPRRRRTQNKFEAGTVVALAGSHGMMGAASLSCEAAHTVGAGYVRALLPESAPFLEGLLPREAIKTFFKKPADCLPYFERADSFLIGPGLGRTPATFSLLDKVWPHLHVPAVIDADALFWLSTIHQKDWDIRGKILTPHLGEAGRMFQKKITCVDEDLLRDLRAIVAATDSIIVLKGAPTFILSAGSPVFIMPRGDPGMATAGAGDVLTGMIAGFLAQKTQPLAACLLGTWVHGLAGEIAASERTSYATLASSILNEIPSALSLVLEQAAHGAFRDYVPFGRVESSRVDF